jgi:hypothetical protein
VWHWGLPDSAVRGEGGVWRGGVWRGHVWRWGVPDSAVQVLSEVCDLGAHVAGGCEVPMSERQRFGSR